MNSNKEGSTNKISSEVEGTGKLHAGCDPTVTRFWVSTD